MPTDTQGYGSGCKGLQKLCFAFEVLEEDGIYFIWHFRVELDMLYGHFQCCNQTVGNHNTETSGSWPLGCQSLTHLGQ